MRGLERQDKGHAETATHDLNWHGDTGPAWDALLPRSERVPCSPQFASEITMGSLNAQDDMTSSPNGKAVTVHVVNDVTDQLVTNVGIRPPLTSDVAQLEPR